MPKVDRTGKARARSGTSYPLPVAHEKITKGKHIKAKKDPHELGSMNRSSEGLLGPGPATSIASGLAQLNLAKPEAGTNQPTSDVSLDLRDGAWGDCGPAAVSEAAEAILQRLKNRVRDLQSGRASLSEDARAAVHGGLSADGLEQLKTKTSTHLEAPSDNQASTELRAGLPKEGFLLVEYPSRYRDEHGIILEQEDQDAFVETLHVELDRLPLVPASSLMEVRQITNRQDPSYFNPAPGPSSPESVVGLTHPAFGIFASKDLDPNDDLVLGDYSIDTQMWEDEEVESIQDQPSYKERMRFRAESAITSLNSGLWTYLLDNAEGLPLSLDRTAAGQNTQLMCVKHFGNLSLGQVDPLAAMQANAERHINCCFVPVLELKTARPRLLLVRIADMRKGEQFLCDFGDDWVQGHCEDARLLQAELQSLHHATHQG